MIKKLYKSMGLLRDTYTSHAGLLEGAILDKKRGPQTMKYYQVFFSGIQWLNNLGERKAVISKTLHSRRWHKAIVVIQSGNQFTAWLEDWPWTIAGLVVINSLSPFVFRKGMGGLQLPIQYILTTIRMFTGKMYMHLFQWFTAWSYI